MAKNNTTKVTEEHASVETAVQEQVSPKEKIAGKVAVVAAPYGLNLREGPAFNYKVLQELQCGTKLTVLDLPCGAAVPDWALVYTGEQTGWVFAQHIRVEK